MSFLSQLIEHPTDRVAMIDEEGEHTYGELLEQARILSTVLYVQKEDERPVIAFLADQNALSVVSLLAIWLADCIAVPLDPLMSVPQWEWRIRDVKAKQLVFPPDKAYEAAYLGQRCSINVIKAAGHHSPPLHLYLLYPKRRP